MWKLRFPEECVDGNPSLLSFTFQRKESDRLKSRRKNIIRTKYLHSPARNIKSRSERKRPHTRSHSMLGWGQAYSAARVWSFQVVSGGGFSLRRPGCVALRYGSPKHLSATRPAKDLRAVQPRLQSDGLCFGLLFVCIQAFTERAWQEKEGDARN